jgi:hypothetical protein
MRMANGKLDKVLNVLMVAIPVAMLTLGMGVALVLAIWRS